MDLPGEIVLPINSLESMQKRQQERRVVGSAGGNCTTNQFHPTNAEKTARTEGRRICRGKLYYPLIPSNQCRKDSKNGGSSDLPGEIVLPINSIQPMQKRQQERRVVGSAGGNCTTHQFHPTNAEKTARTEGRRICRGKLYYPSIPSNQCRKDSKNGGSSDLPGEIVLPINSIQPMQKRQQEWRVVGSATGNCTTHQFPPNNADGVGCDPGKNT